jgi:hypothetical protein
LIFADTYLFVALAQKTQQKSVHKQSPKLQQQTSRIPQIGEEGTRKKLKKKERRALTL